jgi:hypothetical protein
LRLRYRLHHACFTCIALLEAQVHPTKLCDPVGLRALTVLRFNFKVELEAAMED